MPDHLEEIREIDKMRIPTHIAIIMDGNGRWAKERGYEREYGHQQGVPAVRSVIEGAGEAGVKYLTLFAFSTENWNRPKAEIDALTSLLVKTIHLETENLMENNVRMKIIGNVKDLPDDCQEELSSITDKTKENTGLTVVLALSYSSRWEITEMAKKVASQVRENSLSPRDIDSDTVSQYLSTASIPDPDILIRTGGECRISNFLLWQIAYTELFFLPVMWPDFRKENLFKVILDFLQRQRRFGKTGDQVTHQ